MRECRFYRVSGKVQGVFFRASTRQAALEHRVDGWVRNLPDGDVEAVACGNPEDLQVFENWLRRGPELARVDAVLIETIEHNECDGFTIR
jgi:acylphosphatase